MFQDETGPDLAETLRPVAEQRRSILSAIARQTVMVCLGAILSGSLAHKAQAEDAGEAPLIALAAQSGGGYYSIDTKADFDDQVSLLDWVKRSSELAKPPEKYNRRLQFGKWRGVAYDGSCLDSRGLVLQRDSKTRVVTRQSAVGCSVVAGEWVDPYSDNLFTTAEDIAIDHVVPLKNAYDTGAWKWTANKRCLYFNYQKNDIHLRAVSERENASKSDSSPAQYMPPLRRAQCKYLKDWLMIKIAWNLEIPSEEGDAIKENLRQAGCRDTDFQISEGQLIAERAEIEKSAISCDFRATAP